MSAPIFDFDAQAALKQAREKFEAESPATMAKRLHFTPDRSQVANVAGMLPPDAELKCSQVANVAAIPASIAEAGAGDDAIAERAVVIDIAAHLDRAQRISDHRNAVATQRRHTDRWCACGDYASLAWRIDGREVWLCEACGPPRGLPGQALNAIATTPEQESNP